jgi:hypothetical protein
VEFKNVWLVQKVKSYFEENTIACHKKVVVGEDEDYYYITSESPKKILKSDVIDNEYNAFYKTMLYKIRNNIKLSRKQLQRQDVIDKIKKDCPQYFI